MQSIYEFKVQTIDGKEYDFAQLKGKKVLIVNTASECGYTPQYAELEELYKKFGGEKFTILGFPANNFGGQEPGTNAEIQQFCKKTRAVCFIISLFGSNNGFGYLFNDPYPFNFNRLAFREFTYPFQ